MKAYHGKITHGLYRENLHKSADIILISAYVKKIPRIIERDAVSAPIPCVMLTPGLHFPPLRSSKVTFYPQRYAGGDGNDRYERQRPFTKRQIAAPPFIVIIVFMVHLRDPAITWDVMGSVFRDVNCSAKT